MDCIIIEDERGAVEHLQYLLKQTEYEVNIIANMSSVESSVKWLKEEKADLIFMDIELTEGLSFEIFDHVQIDTPIIFTTAYNQYAIKAFDVNSISYLLKPIQLDDLKNSLKKFQHLSDIHLDQNERMLPIHNTFQKRFLVQSGSALVPVDVEDILFFRVHDHRYIVIVTKDKNQYILSNKMEYLEQRLDPANFFRINRQFIININAINGIYPSDGGRLRVELTHSREELFVGREKAVLFKNWIER